MLDEMKQTEIDGLRDALVIERETRRGMDRHSVEYLPEGKSHRDIVSTGPSRTHVVGWREVLPVAQYSWKARDQNWELVPAAPAAEEHDP